jgi:hypothetical protein
MNSENFDQKVQNTQHPGNRALTAGTCAVACLSAAGGVSANPSTNPCDPRTGCAALPAALTHPLKPRLPLR